MLIVGGVEFEISQIALSVGVLFLGSAVVLVALALHVRRLRRLLFQEVENRSSASFATISNIFQQLHQLSVTVDVLLNQHDERSKAIREAQQVLRGGIDRAVEAAENLEDASGTRNVAQMAMLNGLTKLLGDHIALQTSLQERRNDEMRHFEGLLDQILRSVELQKTEFTPSNPGKLDWATFKRLAREISEAHEEKKP